MWGPNPSLLREKVVVEFPPVGCHHAGGGVYGKIFSPSPTHSDVGFFFPCSPDVQELLS